MKQGTINGRWVMTLPDSVADHDIITGDYSARRGWEFARFESMQRRLRYGMVMYDVGVEHGWISAVLGREFVGAENMVLIEPSQEFWPNIFKTWRYNGLNDPICSINAFAGSATDSDDWLGQAVHQVWPPGMTVDLPECPAMAYRHMKRHSDIHTIALDDLIRHGVEPPHAITIDVEGAELEVLSGADEILRAIRPEVWVSIHPDLMEDFDAHPDQVHAYMNARGYDGTFLGRDHEEHWWYRPIGLRREQ